MAFGNLKPQEAQQASGLINLARQLGGSFGIAVLGVVPHAAHRVSPRGSRHEHVSGQPGVSRSGSTACVAALPARAFSLADAQQRALAILDGTMMRQASMQAYNDAWLLLLVSFICVVPAVFLLRRPRAAQAAAADAH